MSSDLIANLNEQQKAAVTLPEVSSLILAGAGSGKTSVLISRIAFLLEHRLCTPAELFAVTFTNKAAREMMTRLQAKMPLNTRALWVGTFHGLCNRMLRLHHEAAGLPAAFAILDMSDQLGAIKRIMKANNINEEVLPARKIQNYINKQKEEGIRAKDIKPYGFGERDLLRVYEIYEKVINREGAVDFGELILRTYEMLLNNEPIRQHYQDRFKFILVDEFQDTNKLQYKFLKLLAGHEEEGRKPNAVFAVGDDDQSIYAFRGANVGNMKDFIRDFSIGEPIRLEQNYRSQGNILDAANYLISNNSDRLGKNLWTQSGKGDLIRVFKAGDEAEEAAFVVDNIKDFVRNGEDLREIAILYRSNAQSRALETELTRRGVKYTVYGGLRFFDRAEIKNALAYLRLAENTADDSAFMRVVNLPARGIGAKTVENLIDLARDNQISLFEATQLLSGAAANKVRVFTDIINDIRSKRFSLPLTALINYTVQRSGLKALYEADENGAERLENLEELTSSAAAFLSQEGFEEDSKENVDNLSPLTLFLSQATLEAGDNQAKAGEEAVQLMTIHASKGLEFNNVFITGLENGLFPHDKCLAEPKELQEERRLMYVAITRARKKLYLTYAAQRLLHGMPRYNVKSSFLDELPGDALKWLTPKEDSGSYSSFGSGRSGGGYYGSYNSKNSWSEDKRNSYSGYKKTYRNNENVPEWAKNIGITKEDKNKINSIRQSSKNSDGYNIGTIVFHEKFGEGKIKNIEGQGENKKIEVAFKTSGVKNLLLAIAQKKMRIVR